MMKFGPSGNSEIFYEQGYKSTWQAMQWVRNMGLDVYEYSFGRGVKLSEETASVIAEKAKEADIKISVHAPFFINLANPDREKIEKSFDYITSGGKILKVLGGDRMVVHVGAQMKMERKEALSNCRNNLKEALLRMDDLGLYDLHLCPETMGRRSQIGDLKETLDFCLLDERLIPCIDFAHLHALWGGALNETEDFAKVLDEIESTLGMDRARKIHCHFSTIEFTKAGEKQHRTFAEEKYGPRFEKLAPLFKERNYDATVICECKGTMAQDALTMKKIYQAL